MLFLYHYRHKYDDHIKPPVTILIRFNGCKRFKVAVMTPYGAFTLYGYVTGGLASSLKDYAILNRGFNASTAHEF